MTTVAEVREPPVQQSRRDRSAVAGLIVALVVVRTVVSLRGYLLQDDFAVRFRAADRSWSLGYAFEPYNDHISPVGYSLQWLLQWAFPGSHIALVLTTSVLMAVTLVCVAGLVWALTQRLVGIVIACVITGLGLFTFEVGTWWCVSLYSMTYLAFVSFSLWMAAGVIRFEAPKAAVLVGFVGAVVSDSKGFLGLVLVFGLVAGIDLNGHGPLGLRGAWRRMTGVWIGALAVSGIMLALSAWTTTGVQGNLTVGRALALMRDLWVINIAPAVFGGPWWWTGVPMFDWSPVRYLPDTPPLIGWLCLGLCGLGLWMLARRRSVRGFVAYALLYSLATTAIPVLGRAGTDLASPAYRYTYDVVLPAAILMALIVAPLWWQRQDTARWKWVVPVGLTVSMTASTVVPAIAWGRNGAKDYVSRAASGFDAVREDEVVIPEGVPDEIVPNLLFWQYANTEAVLSPQPGAPTFGSLAGDPLLGFGSNGELQRQEVEGPASLPGPDPNCGYRVTDAPRIIPLDGAVIAWEFMARVAYFSAVDTTMYMAVGGKIHTVPLSASEITAVHFEVDGPATDVLVSIGTPGATVCVTDVRIGNRVDAATGARVPAVPEGLPE